MITITTTITEQPDGNVLITAHAEGLSTEAERVAASVYEKHHMAALQAAAKALTGEVVQHIHQPILGNPNTPSLS